jgi:hypothetical protein
MLHTYLYIGNLILNSLRLLINYLYSNQQDKNSNGDSALNINSVSISIILSK